MESDLQLPVFHLFVVNHLGNRKRQQKRFPPFRLTRPKMTTYTGTEIRFAHKRRQDEVAGGTKRRIKNRAP
jgi:hypothetical protein